MAALSRSIASFGNFFGNKFIRVILLSSFFLQIGVWVRNFAVLLYVMEQTNNDSVAVSWIYIAEYAPIFIFSVIGGTFADRWRPKKTMVNCDLLSALSILIVLVALMEGSWRAIFFTTLISTILSQFSQPSGMKLFKQHVPEEQIQTGMAMYQALSSLFMVIGPAIGTLVFSTFGIYVSIGLVGIAFLMSAVMLTMLPADRIPSTNNNKPSVLKELKDGFRYVFIHPVLRLLGIAFALGGLAVGITQPLGIFLVVDRLHMDKEFFQWFSIANVIAMVIGGAFVVGISKRISSQKILAIGNLISAFSAVGLGLSMNFNLSLLMQFVRGFVQPFIQVGINTIVMKSTEEAYVGRVNGLFGPVFMGTMLLSIMLSGWLSTFVPLVTMFVMSGVFFLIATGVISLMFKLELSTKYVTAPEASVSNH
ncbi:MFS transporter [Paenibacillus xylaniclasticus]|uniref:MFS transporter n=1 Tax=Paenibacillus xylaniclasticus TaxID=588083 RepID=UPI00175B0892|nr:MULTISPECIES: MFS transporter [Paenibacillus]GFN30742.1 MFS transporter [Paenibacillus curdlanolyticus]